MKIRLKNIGIISDSSLEIKGLTVITGHNNSGKTTVGKVIYSLIDAVSNIQQKSRNDRYHYALAELDKANEEFSFRYSLKHGKDEIPNECLHIFFSENFSDDIDEEGIELYIRDLISELGKLNLHNEPYQSILEKYSHRQRLNQHSYMDTFEQEKANAVSILENALFHITRDPELINYTRQSISATLSVEFSGQIQPAALADVSSAIEVTDNDRLCFKIILHDNKICDSDTPVFESSPYKRAFFIDNPFILDEPAFRKVTRYTTANLSYVNESRILTHDNKLKFILNAQNTRSIFEEEIIDEHYKKIKEKIDYILPGNFTFSDGDRFYVCNNIKLKTSNLATGSKMFSIIKMLLEKGEIDKNTILILDEPEAHLHPKWQNMFAEILILLIKEIGCHILLTTHSPNFMLALDAYMRKYEAVELCNFYQTKHNENSPFVSYQCVNNCMDTIYEDFVSFLSDMKNLRNIYMHEQE